MDIDFFKSFQTPHFSFFKKEKSILGIDMGAASVKLVQVRLSDEHAVLETYGELSAGPYAAKSIGQGVRLSSDKAVEIIRDLVRETGSTAKETVVSIPLRNSFVTNVEIPKITEGDIDAVMQYEARRYIPVPLAEVVMDWWQVPDMTRSEEGTVSCPSYLLTYVCEMIGKTLWGLETPRVYARFLNMGDTPIGHCPARSTPSQIDNEISILAHF